MHKDVEEAEYAHDAQACRTYVKEQVLESDRADDWNADIVELSSVLGCWACMAAAAEDTHVGGIGCEARDTKDVSRFCWRPLFGELQGSTSKRVVRRERHLTDRGKQSKRRG